MQPPAEHATASAGLTAGTRLPDPTDVIPDHSGAGITGDSFTYEVVVPGDTPFVRFDLRSSDQLADLDLEAVLVDSDGNPVAGFTSATGAADERIDISAPDAGTYKISVSVYSAPQRTVFDLTSYVLSKAGAPLTLTPAVIDARQGVPATVTAAWSGLKPRSSYLGRIIYGDTGYVTTLDVTTGAPALLEAALNLAPPVLSGDPIVGRTLRVTPGQWNVAELSYRYRWQANGADIPDETSAGYTVRGSDQGKVLTVRVTAGAANRTPATADSNPVSVKYTSKTTLAVGKNVLTAAQQQTVTVRVVTPAQSAVPVGTVTILVNGRSVRQLPLPSSANGLLKLTLPKFAVGSYSVRATYISVADTVAGSTSTGRYFVVVR